MALWPRFQYTLFKELKRGVATMHRYNHQPPSKGGSSLQAKKYIQIYSSFSMVSMFNCLFLYWSTFMSVIYPMKKDMCPQKIKQYTFQVVSSYLVPTWHTHLRICCPSHVRTQIQPILVWSLVHNYNTLELHGGVL